MSQAFRESGLKFKSEDDRPKVARFCEADFSDSPSLTSQAPADEVDINKIMARVQKGHTVMTSTGTPFYGDVSDLGGLQDAYMKVQEAEDLFMQYPAEVREKFENDPIKMVSFLEDPKNKEEAIKLGLVNKPIQAVPEPPAAPPAGGAATSTQ